MFKVNEVIFNKAILKIILKLLSNYFYHLPIISIWLIVYQIINQPVIIKRISIDTFIILLTLFSSRTFSLMHDCGHNLFLQNGN